MGGDSSEEGCGYCATVDAGARAERGLPAGYCGFCERCGRPGHIAHFPGPLPYTGIWCAHCYRVLAFTWPLRVPAGRIALGVCAICGALLIWSC